MKSNVRLDLMQPRTPIAADAVNDVNDRVYKAGRTGG